MRGAVLVAWNRSRHISARPLCTRIDRGREVAERELVALLGDLRCGRDVDDERHTLRCSATCAITEVRAGIERADQQLRAVVDQLLGPCPREVGVGFEVDVHQLDVGRRRLLDDLRAVSAPLLARPGRAARARPISAAAPRSSAWPLARGRSPGTSRPRPVPWRRRRGDESGAARSRQRGWLRGSSSALSSAMEGSSGNCTSGATPPLPHSP